MSASYGRGTSPTFIGLSGPVDGVRFAVGSRSRAAEREHRIDERSVSELIALPNSVFVIHDYEVLSTRLVQSLLDAKARLKLLPPPHWSEKSRTVLEIVQLAIEEHHLLRRYTAPSRDAFRPFLKDRAHTLQRLAKVEARIIALLRDHSSDYASLVAPGGRLNRRMVPLLKHHPTPGSLLIDGPHRLARSFGLQGGLNDHLMVDRLMHLGEQSQRTPYDRTAAEVAETLIPGLASEYEVVANHVSIVDSHIFEFTGDIDSHETSYRIVPLGGTAPPLRPLRRNAPSDAPPQATTGTLDELFTQVSVLFESRHRIPGRARVVFDRYRELRAAMRAAELVPPPEMQAQLAVWGQFFAVECGEFPAEARYSAEAHDALARVDAHDDATAEHGALARCRADAEIGHALAGTIGVDAISELSSLRRAVRSGSPASPPLLREGRAVLAMVLATTGSRQESWSLLEQLSRTDLDDEAALRSARDPIEIATHVFQARWSPEFAADADIRMPDLHIYEPYCLFAKTLLATRRRDLETALAYSEQLRQDPDRWPPDRHLARAAELMQAMLSAASGDVARARAYVGHVIENAQVAADTGSELLALLMQIRLDLAVGAYERVIAATSPGGMLADQNILHIWKHLAPLTYMLKGSAFWAAGDRKLSATLFRRVLQRSSFEEEHLALMIAETTQFREWMNSLSPREREAASESLIVELTSKRVFIDRTLPALTRQQSKVLFLLATGRSTATIARELSVSANTLKTHLRLLYRKLEVGSREHAVLIAESYGILSSDRH